ncbi:Outer membrane protein slp [anaerobic digester metagenome]|uniref:Outer membrane protein slp n=1 Tax=anaerobic digester metagenome TaxID=1263854 RepID=A0A485LXM9_9ZZZZ|nr:Slp family lipoprotein [Deltaproteobacteria bacterium]
MKTQRFLLIALLLSTLLLISSCASSLCRDLRKGVDESVLLPLVIENPQAYEGRRVLWGGTILETNPQREGTVIELLERPLGSGCEPRDGDATGGRFLAVSDRFLDPAIYTRGRKVTVVGTIDGVEFMTIGEYEYPYPVVSMTNHVLWPHRGYREYYSYPGNYPYYTYYPFYDPFYRPLWFH